MTASPSVVATCIAVTSTGPLLSSVALTACGDYPDVSFSHTLVSNGSSVLAVTWAYTAGRNLTGRHLIPGTDIVWTNQQSPTGTVQAYVGPSDLVMTDLQSAAAVSEQRPSAREGGRV